MSPLFFGQHPCRLQYAIGSSSSSFAALATLRFESSSKEATPTNIRALLRRSVFGSQRSLPRSRTSQSGLPNLTTISVDTYDHRLIIALSAGRILRIPVMRRRNWKQTSDTGSSSPLTNLRKTYARGLCSAGIQTATYNLPIHNLLIMAEKQ